MNKFLFKGNEYNLKQIIELRSLSPLYKEGDVIDLQTGEITSVSNLEELKIKYFDELITSKQKSNFIKNMDYTQLKHKYEKGIITKDEMYIYLQFINQEKINPNYNYDKGYIIVNLNKIPENITDAEYGKFHKMLSYLSSNHHNRISYSNQNPVSKKDISEFLKYKDIRYFNEYLRKLKKHNLLDEQTYGDIKYIIINPAYAKKNMEIDSTIYRMFKKDLDECLTKEQLYYLNMYDENIELSSMIPLLD